MPTPDDVALFRFAPTVISALDSKKGGRAHAPSHLLRQMRARCQTWLRAV
jgi:hypothetical protein